MRGSRIAAAIVAVALVVVAVVALTRAGADAGRPDRDGVLTVVMRNYTFEPDAWTVTAGERVVFRFVNDDEVTHHVSMGRGLAEADGRAVAFESDLFEQLEVEVRPASARVELPEPYRGVTVEVRGGATVDVATTFTAGQVGEWQVGCFTGRGCHFRAGLDALLTIEPAG